MRLPESSLLICRHGDVPALEHLLGRSIRHLFAESVLVEPVAGAGTRLFLGCCLHELVEGFLDLGAVGQSLMVPHRCLEPLDKLVELQLSVG